MLAAIETPEALFRYRLALALGMERVAGERIAEFLAAAEGEPLRTALEAHLQDAREHAGNAEVVFDVMGWPLEAESCPALEAIADHGRVELRRADSKLADRVILDWAMQTAHFEVAVYEGLIIDGWALGMRTACRLLHESLDSERQALDRVATLASRIAAVGQVAEAERVAVPLRSSDPAVERAAEANRRTARGES